MAILEIGEIRREYAGVHFKITKQDTTILRRHNFEKTMDNGVNIVSCAYPEIKEQSRDFFVRGSRSEKDDNVCVCSEEFFEEIQEAIKEPNERFGYEEVYE